MDGSLQTNDPTPHPELEFVSTLSVKGGVTIPLEVRRFLKVKPKDKVRFRIHREAVAVEPGPMTLEEAMGSVKPLQTDKELEEIIKEAKVEHIQQRFLKKMQA